MAKRFRCIFVLALLAACLCLHVGGQQAPSPAAIRQEHDAEVAATLSSRLTLDCTANSESIALGHLSVIRAVGTSPAGRPLRYSFRTDAGQVVTRGDTAELHAVGLNPGVVHVTCTVMDDLGHSASKVVVVSVRPAQVEMRPDTPGARPVTPPLPQRAPAQEAPQQVSRMPPVIRTTPTQATTTAPQQGEKITRPQPVQAVPAPTAAAPSPASSAGVAAGEYQQGTAVEEWKKGLKTGKIEYQVPTRMLMQQASTVTVVIHGYQDVGSVSLPGATGTGSLKQSERMKVELLAPDHPDAFTIALQGGDAVQFVPIDGATTWMWSVTPNSPGQKQRLMVRASVIYPGGDDKTQEQLPDYSAVVEVDVPSTWSLIVENYRKDPLKWFSYVIPGGAGFTFLVGIIVWWRKKKKKE